MKYLLPPLLCGLIFCTLLFSAAGQTIDDDSYKPYVSKLKASVMDSYIILTWENPDNINRTIFVYRYTEKITTANLDLATQITSLEPDKQSFIHYPEDTREYYFAVNYALSTGEPNGVLVAYRNITTQPVKVTAVGQEEDRATHISGIKAEAGSDSIVVTFKSSKPTRELILYRRTQPILTTDDLLQASFYLVLGKETTAYIDYPVAGIQYYYAVMDAELVKTGKISLLKDENTTTTPVFLTALHPETGTEVRESKRSLPLPLLSLSSDLESGSGLINSVASLLPREKSISAETENIVADLLQKIYLQEDVAVLPLQVMDIDTIESEFGEAHTLQTIINDYLKTGKYEEAESELDTFLRINRSSEITARSHFYRGQAYYFQNNYQSALLEFLITSDVYYAETQPWIDNCFQFLLQATG